jgi:hypothetical protein
LEANPFDFPAAKSCHLQRVKTTGFRTAIDFRRDGPDSQFGKRNPLTPAHHDEGFFRRDSATRYHYFGSLRSFHHDSYELNIQVFLEKSAIAEIAELIFAHFVAKIAPCAEILVHRLVAQ